MERRAFGKTGMQVSVLGFGGAEIGFEGASDETVTKVLNEALDAGLNVIDTAECYNDSEEKIGRAVSHRRGDYHLFTKVGHEHGLGKGEDWSEASILRTVERALKRLKTDALDLVQLHSCSMAVLRKGEATGALEKARAAGKTRFIGYSGDGVNALVAIESGRFDALQTSISIADQQVLADVLPAAAARGMGVIAKRPVANAVWRHETMVTNPYQQPYWKRLRELQYEFCRKPLGEAVATALRFTLSQPGVHTAIVGTTKPGRYAQNAAAAALGPLPRAEVDAIMARWKAVAKPDWTGCV